MGSEGEVETRLHEIRQRLYAATKGPWTYIHGYGFRGAPDLEGDGPPTPDKRFVGHAWKDIEWLVALVEATRK